MNGGTWALFVAAAAVGAPARYLVDRAVDHWHRGLMPWGILVVNVSGSLALGILTGLGLYHGLGETPRLVLGTGFCGAFTTFSTFTHDTVRLLEAGDTSAAAKNLAFTVAACAAGAAGGIALAAL